MKEEHSSNTATSPADPTYCTANDLRTAAEHALLTEPQCTQSERTDPKEASVATCEEGIETKSSDCISDQRTYEPSNIKLESTDCDINTSPVKEKSQDQEKQETPVSTAPGTFLLYM